MKDVKDFFNSMHYEVNPKKDAEIIGRLISNPQIKKHLVQRTVCIAVALFLWIYINGGIFFTCLNLDVIPIDGIFWKMKFHLK
jgi:hypothetical protein